MHTAGSSLPSYFTTENFIFKLPLFLLKFAFVKGSSIRFTHQSLKLSMNMLEKRIFKPLVLAKSSHSKQNHFSKHKNIHGIDFKANFHATVTHSRALLLSEQQ